MKNLLQGDFDEEIPLGHAIFLISTGIRGAQMIPEMMSFQVDGKIYDASKIASDIFDEELLSALDNLRSILRAKAEEEQQS
ncbi:hypothetical protein GX441_03000 [bacterium]|nr:hypothetical protein [bacterium]